MPQKKSNEWGGWIDQALSINDEFNFPRNSVVSKISRKIRKAINLVLLGQSLLIHTAGVTTLSAASNCAQSCSQDDSKNTDKSDKNAGQNIPKVSDKVAVLTQQYPDVAKMSSSQQETFLGLYERDKEIIEQRQKELEERVDKTALKSLKDKLKSDLENGKPIQFNEFFKQHELVALASPSGLIVQGDAFLERKAQAVKQDMRPSNVLKTLQEIAAITETPADYNPDVEEDMLNVSVYKYLASISNPSPEKVIGACQPKAKAAIMLLEKVFPDKGDKIFYVREYGHTYAAIEIDGSLYAINSGKAYKLKSKDRFGTDIYSPYRAIRNFAGLEVPPPIECRITAMQSCLLNQAEAVHGEKKKIVIPKNIGGGLRLPADTESDGIDASDGKNLLSKAQNITQFYPDFDDKYRAEMLEKIAHADSPVFYSQSLKKHYLDVGANKDKWGDSLEQEIKQVLSADKAGHLVLDFGNSERYSAENLKRIFDMAEEIQTNIIFDGISDTLLRTIAHSNINGEITFVFTDQQTFERSRGNLTKLLSFQNASNFDINLAFGEPVNIDQRLVSDIIAELEKNPVKVTIHSNNDFDISDEIQERIDKLNTSKEQPIEFQAYQGAYDLNNAGQLTMYRLKASSLRVKYGNYNSAIGRLSGTITPHLTSKIASRIAQSTKAGDYLAVRYQIADKDAFQDFEGLKVRSLEIDSDHLFPDEAAALSKVSMQGLELNGLTNLTPEAAHNLKNFKGNYINLDGLTTLTPETARELSQIHKNVTLSFNGLKDLSPDTARELVKFQGRLFFGGITTLSKETAHELAKFKSSDLFFNGLGSLTADVAHQLAKFQGSLYLGITDLSPEVAREFATFKGSLRLTLFNITPEIARELGQYKAERLDLDRVKEISPAALRELALFRGALSLGLTSMSPSVAHELISFSGHKLWLNSLTSLSDEAVNELSHTNCPSVKLGGIKNLTGRVARFISLKTTHEEAIVFYDLKKLSPEAAEELVKNTNSKELVLADSLDLSLETAEKLAQFKGDIYLNRVRHLDPEVARAFSKLNGELHLPSISELNEETLDLLKNKSGNEIKLDNVKYITPAQAKQLAAFKGKEMLLDGLTDLTPEAAKELSGFQGRGIGLYGIRDLSTEAAKELNNMKGYIWLKDLTGLNPETVKLLNKVGGNITLDQVQVITPEVAQILSQSSGKQMFLDGLTDLSLESARELSKFKGDILGINSITLLSPKVAAALAQFQGSVLGINGITSLTPETASAIAVFAGDSIGLKHLESLSPEAAQKLASFHGKTLWLDGLSSISIETARELKNFKGKRINLSGLTSLTVEIIKELRQFGGNVVFSNRLLPMARKYWNAKD